MADQIYYNGTILTMNDEAPLASAVAVQNGTIVQVETGDDQGISIMEKCKGRATSMVDLHGATMLPGFIDAHSHFGNALQVVDWANLSPPPVGQVTDIRSLLGELTKFKKERNITQGEWIIGYGYDGNELADGRDVTIKDLDPVFSENPLLIIHVSNHGVVLNSIAMEYYKINETTETPEAGVIARLPGTNIPAGLLMETAAAPVFKNFPNSEEVNKLANVHKAQMDYAKHGYTTLQEGATQEHDYNVLTKAAKDDVDFNDTSYHNHLKVGGVKLILDGSPQGKTAYFTKPYLSGGPNGEANKKTWTNYTGSPSVPYDYVIKLAKHIHRKGAKLFNHCNGDGAIDMTLKVLKELGVNSTMDRRDVVVHSQFVRPDQLDNYVKLGVCPSFFTNHAFYWGDVHVKNLGKERAEFLSPMKAAKDRGIHLTNHNDYTVTPLNPMTMIWSAVTRTTRTGKTLGSDQRVGVMTALKAMTIEGAYQYHEEKNKGSIEVGKVADFVIIDKNPLAVNETDLKDLQVLKTVKDGKVVFEK